VFEHAGLEETANQGTSASRGVLARSSWASARVSPTRSSSAWTVFGDLRTLESETALKPERAGSLRNVYPLRPGCEYEVALDAYSSSGTTPYSDAIAPTSSSDRLTVQAVTQGSAGRASQAILVVRAGDVYRPQVATLIIHGAAGFEHLVPRVELTARIKPNLFLALVLLVVIAVGVVLGGLPSGAFGVGDPVLYGIKILGGVIVGGATVVAMGRAPGVGR
jgi:hypothetical protein